MRKKRINNIIVEGILWILSLIVLVPVFFMFINGLKTPEETLGTLTIALPSRLDFDNWKSVLEGGGVLRSFLNSFIYASVSVSITCVLSAMASFVIVRKNTRLNRFIFLVFLIGMIAPGNIVTTFKTMTVLKLINTYHGLILLYVAVFTPISIFLYNGFIRGLPMELDEAAMIDGASPFVLFWKIIFPLLKPVTVTVFILNFVSCWNDFYFPLYFLSDSHQWSVILLLYQYMGQFSQQTNMLFAAASIVILPAVLVYILGQKYIIDGMTAGAVKG